MSQTTPFTGIAAGAMDLPPALAPRIAPRFEATAGAHFNEAVIDEDIGWLDVSSAEVPSDDDFTGIAMLLRSFGVDTLTDGADEGDIPPFDAESPAVPREASPPTQRRSLPPAPKPPLSSHAPEDLRRPQHPAGDVVAGASETAPDIPRHEASGISHDPLGRETFNAPTFIPLAEESADDAIEMDGQSEEVRTSATTFSSADDRGSAPARPDPPANNLFETSGPARDPFESSGRDALIPRISPHGTAPALLPTHALSQPFEDRATDRAIDAARYATTPPATHEGSGITAIPEPFADKRRVSHDVATHNASAPRESSGKREAFNSPDIKPLLPANGDHTLQTHVGITAAHAEQGREIAFDGTLANAEAADAPSGTIDDRAANLSRDDASTSSPMSASANTRREVHPSQTTSRGFAEHTPVESISYDRLAGGVLSTRTSSDDAPSAFLEDTPSHHVEDIARNVDGNSLTAPSPTPSPVIDRGGVTVSPEPFTNSPKTKAPREVYQAQNASYNVATHDASGALSEPFGRDAFNTAIPVPLAHPSGHIASEMNAEIVSKTDGAITEAPAAQDHDLALSPRLQDEPFGMGSVITSETRSDRRLGSVLEDRATNLAEDSAVASSPTSSPIVDRGNVTAINESLAKAPDTDAPRDIPQVKNASHDVATQFASEASPELFGRPAFNTPHLAPLAHASGNITSEMHGVITEGLTSQNDDIAFSPRPQNEQFGLRNDLTVELPHDHSRGSVLEDRATNLAGDNALASSPTSSAAIDRGEGTARPDPFTNSPKTNASRDVHQAKAASHDVATRFASEGSPEPLRHEAYNTPTLMPLAHDSNDFTSEMHGVISEALTSQNDDTAFSPRTQNESFGLGNDLTVESLHDPRRGSAFEDRATNHAGDSDVVSSSTSSTVIDRGGVTANSDPLANTPRTNALRDAPHARDVSPTVVTSFASEASSELLGRETSNTSIQAPLAHASDNVVSDMDDTRSEARAAQDHTLAFSPRTQNEPFGRGNVATSEPLSDRGWGSDFEDRGTNPAEDRAVASSTVIDRDGITASPEPSTNTPRTNASRDVHQARAASHDVYQTKATSHDVATPFASEASAELSGRETFNTPNRAPLAHASENVVSEIDGIITEMPAAQDRALAFSPRTQNVPFGHGNVDASEPLFDHSRVSVFEDRATNLAGDNAVASSSTPSTLIDRGGVTARPEPLTNTPRTNASRDVHQAQASHDVHQAQASHDVHQAQASHDVYQAQASHDVHQTKAASHNVPKRFASAASPEPLRHEALNTPNLMPLAHASDNVVSEVDGIITETPAAQDHTLAFSPRTQNAPFGLGNDLTVESPHDRSRGSVFENHATNHAGDSPVASSSTSSTVIDRGGLTARPEPSTNTPRTNTSRDVYQTQTASHDVATRFVSEAASELSERETFNAPNLVPLAHASDSVLSKMGGTITEAPAAQDHTIAFSPRTQNEPFGRGNLAASEPLSDRSRGSAFQDRATNHAGDSAVVSSSTSATVINPGGVAASPEPLTNSPRTNTSRDAHQEKPASHDVYQTKAASRDVATPFASKASSELSGRTTFNTPNLAPLAHASDSVVSEIGGAITETPAAHYHDIAPSPRLHNEPVSPLDANEAPSLADPMRLPHRPRHDGGTPKDAAASHRRLQRDGDGAPLHATASDNATNLAVKNGAMPSFTSSSADVRGAATASPDPFADKASQTNARLAFRDTSNASRDVEAHDASKPRVIARNPAHSRSSDAPAHPEALRNLTTSAEPFPHTPPRTHAFRGASHTDPAPRDVAAHDASTSDEPFKRGADRTRDFTPLAHASGDDTMTTHGGIAEADTDRSGVRNAISRHAQPSHAVRDPDSVDTRDTRPDNVRRNTVQPPLQGFKDDGDTGEVRTNLTAASINRAESVAPRSRAFGFAHADAHAAPLQNNVPLTPATPPAAMREPSAKTVHISIDRIDLTPPQPPPPQPRRPQPRMTLERYRERLS